MVMSSFEQYFTALRGKSVAVLGLGVSNRPLVRLLLEYGAIVSGGDRTPREKLDAEVLELERLGCKLYLGENFHLDMQAEIAHLKATSGAKFFDPSQNDVFPQGDFAMCTDLNKFDFVLRLKKTEDGPAYMEKITMGDKMI